MANVSRVRGFVPIRHIDGSAYNDQSQMYFVDGTVESTALFIGDVVVHGGTSGPAGKVVSGVDVEGMPTVTHSTLTTTGTTIVGVIVGFLMNTTIPFKYNPASTDRIALVCTDPSVVYEVQEDGVTSQLAATAAGANIAFSSGAGSTVTGLSAYKITSNDTSTSSAYPWKLLGLVKRPDNALSTGGTSDLAKWEVVINSGGFVSQATAA